MNVAKRIRASGRNTRMRSLSGARRRDPSGAATGQLPAPKLAASGVSTSESRRSPPGVGVAPMRWKRGRRSAGDLKSQGGGPWVEAGCIEVLSR
jgi:hypothetical protein